MADLNKVQVIVWTDYGTQYETEGLMTGDEEYCYLPKKSRIVVKPMTIRAKDKTIVYAPEKTHGNLDKNFLIDLAKAQKYKIKLFHKNIDGLVLESITECTGSIDPKIFNNSISPSFGTDGATIVRSKILQVLQEISDKQQMTMFIFGALAGIPTGIVLTFIAGSVF